MPFPRRNSGLEAAQRTVREAFEDLERAVSPADSRDFEDATLQSVQKAALDIESQLGMRSSLRNMRRLMPLFSGLEHYSGAIEVLCNGAPYLPWLWAPIKLILKVASDYVEAIEQIIKAYSRIGDSLARFRVLDRAFSQNADFQQTLAVFYADILRFHKQAYKFVRRSCWKVLFLTSWGRFQRRFDNIIDDLKRHEEQIDKEANTYHIVEARDTRKKLEAWRQDTLAKLARDEEEQTASHLQTISTWLKLDETDQLAIFDKVSTEGAKYPETCGWILENPTMRSWLRTQPENPFIWLQGNPGTGKSVIVGQLVNFLRASQSSLVVTHFCTYSYASSTQYDKILRSLLFQLVHANDDLIAHIYWEYVVGKKMASVAALEQLLTTVVTALLGEPGQSQVIHVFLDGLDEFEAEKQRQVVNLMRKVARGAQARGAVFKVLVSCRTSPLLEKVLRKNPVVSLSDEKEFLEEAIWTYASQRLTADAHRLSQLGLRGSNLTDMGRSIAIKADGMFLWARLVLDYLATNIFHSRHEITAAINTLPRKLSEFYARMLMNIIANFDARSVGRMRQILGWIAFAKRPLRKIEFQSALSFSAGDPTVDEPVPSYIFDMCAPLIEQRRDSSFAFIHVSVKDYLQTAQSKVLITKDNVIREHGIASITCLLSGLEVFQPDYPSSVRSLRVLKGLHGFHVYANEYWVDYILSIVTSHDALSQPPLLSLVVNDLSRKLDSLGESSNALDNEEDSMPSENGLDLLKEHKGLYASARAALEARSRKRLGDEIGKGGSATSLEQVKELRDVLANYQANIKFLLLIQDFPGVTPEELELFKREFRTSAYTCSLPSCPRATAGFDTNELRLEHEATHTQRLRCLYPGCQYPPFTSARALKNHEIKYHETVQGRKRIRRVAAWPQHYREGSRQAERGGEELSEAHPVFHRDSTGGASSHSNVPMTTGPPDLPISTTEHTQRTETLAQAQRRFEAQADMQARRRQMQASANSLNGVGGAQANGAGDEVDSLSVIKRFDANGEDIAMGRIEIDGMTRQKIETKMNSEHGSPLQSPALGFDQLNGEKIPEGGPFNPQNAASQFMGAGPGQRSPPAMAANMNPQHQMQASPIPGQQPSQAPMGIPNQGPQNMAQNQQQQFLNMMQQGALELHDWKARSLNLSTIQLPPMREFPEYAPSATQPAPAVSSALTPPPGLQNDLRSLGAASVNSRSSESAFDRLFANSPEQTYKYSQSPPIPPTFTQQGQQNYMGAQSFRIQGIRQSKKPPTVGEGLPPPLDDISFRPFPTSMFG